jgi:signal transduction histidine kinase
MDPFMSWSICTLTIGDEYDVVAAGQRARQIADLLGFDLQGQTGVSAAVSEVGRMACIYAGISEVEFMIEGETVPQVLLVRISERVPGNNANNAMKYVLEYGRPSESGPGDGLATARRLMDRLEIESKPGQRTSIWLKKMLPAKATLITETELRRIAGQLSAQPAQSPFDQLREQNQELLRALEELRWRQRELARLNRELEDTNRGIVALYAELDEKADHLRRAGEAKTRFLSNMSHEFRTPLISIQALTQMLLEQVDGQLTAEQERQVSLIRKAAQGLHEMVNDLLDIARIEAGRIVVRPAEFEVANLFSALRGMLRPLLINRSVKLVFEEPSGLPLLDTDEGKVSQILRNFISNALKFTERGEVRVSAALAEDGGNVIFAVADTGIGIAPEDQKRVFDEFEQVENVLQKRVRGTGLGLPLCLRLAALLGGTLSVTSQPGVGATFRAVIPIRYSGNREEFGAADCSSSSRLIVPGDGSELLIDAGK